MTNMGTINTIKHQDLHIHLDLVGGIAGDMFISAMLDAFDYLQADVLCAIALVLPKEAGIAKISQGVNSGISGLRFCLETGLDTKEIHSHSDHHQHDHRHSGHSHTHDHETTYRALCQRLANSPLDDKISNIGIKLLTIIGEAEAKIHAKTLDDVHFHELADWDSLMDVVASAVILNALADCSWSHSKLPLGGGLVQTQHGLIPVPAPATSEILKGFEFVNDGIQGERITPTGAAILCYLKNSGLLINQPQGQLTLTGYGLGTKVLPNMPNILRALCFKNISSRPPQQDSVVVIEFDIDDMTGEELALSLDILREQDGVIDLVVQTARGKKSRAVELIRILASNELYQSIIDMCFTQTSTIGLRYSVETRRVLSREHYVVNSHAVKNVMRPNQQKTLKVEHEELSKYSTLKERRAVKHKIESTI